MTTIAAGSSASVTLEDGGQVAVATNGGMWRTVETPIIGAVRTAIHGPLAHTRVFGAYVGGATLDISNLTANSLVYVEHEVGTTSTTNVAAGSTDEFTLDDQGTVTIATNGGFWSVTVTPIIGGATTGIYGPGSVHQQFGPFAVGATVSITNQTCDTLLAVSTAAAEPPPEPSTIQVSAANVALNLGGAVSYTKDAERVYTSFSTVWAGHIVGTEAKMTASSDFGSNDDLLEVSVDGGAFGNVPRSGNVFTLFTGLANSSHYVLFRWSGSYGSFGYMPSSGNVMEVTGVNPSVSRVHWYQVDDENSLTMRDATLNTSMTDYVPESLVQQSNSTDGLSVPCLVVRGAFSELTIFGNGGTEYAISVDGAAPTFYAVGTPGSPYVKHITGLSGTHTYYIWGDGTNAADSPRPWAVGTDVAAVSLLTTSRHLDQYGDSITVGTGATCAARVDTMRVAAHFGMCGSTCGVAGETVAELASRLDVVLPKRPISATDVAIFAAGRNGDLSTSTAFNSCISKLRARYNTVIVRGLLPVDGVPDPHNANLSAYVTALADANVHYVDTDSWVIDLPDDTHPSDLGYTQLTAYEIAAYAAFI
jgi:hypothetical protein